MQPNSESILFDMDGTIMNYYPSWTLQMQKRYKQVQSIERYPMTEYMIKTISPLAGCLCQDIINSNRFYIDEEIYPESYKLVKELIDKKFDVWFVTAPIVSYNRRQSIEQKLAQIQRYFGIQYLDKVIFSSAKFEVEGKYLIDDHPMHPSEEERASWKAILVEHEYNKDVECSRRVSPGSMVQDFWRILGVDESDVKQQKQIE